jgi:hypothetical protein
MRLVGSLGLAGLLSDDADSLAAAELVWTPPGSFDMVAQGAGERGGRQRL